MGKQLVYLSLVISLLFSCKQEDGADLGLLPSSKGDRGEMILVMDSTKWKGALGEAIRDVFEERVSGLPRPQPMFTVRYIKPHLFSGLLKHHHNIVIVTTFDSNSSGTRILKANFTPESVKRLKQDKSLYRAVKENEFAKGQIVMHLFSENESQLIEKLTTNKKDIQDYFNQIEGNRVRKKLFSEKGNAGVMESMKTNHNFTIHVPTGYRVAKDTTGFLWLRHPEAKFDKNLFISYKPYTSEDQFDEENIIAWRNRIARKHIYGDPDNPASYVVTERLDPVTFEKVDFNGMYAVKSLGRWKTNNISMGGPFVSYVFTDQASGKLYYLEGFVYSPSIKQREIMRELSTILNTFKL